MLPECRIMWLGRAPGARRIWRMCRWWQNEKDGCRLYSPKDGNKGDSKLKKLLCSSLTHSHTHSLQINTHSTPKGDKEELELSYESELRDKFERIKILNNAQHIPHKPHLCETNKSEYKRVCVSVCVWRTYHTAFNDCCAFFCCYLHTAHGYRSPAAHLVCICSEHYVKKFLLFNIISNKSVNCVRHGECLRPKVFSSVQVIVR